MRIVLFILRKEVRQIFRNRAMLPIIFVLPIVQLLVLAFAATFEVRSTRISLVDQDKTEMSRRLVRHFEATGYFEVVAEHTSEKTASDEILAGNARMVMVIPPDFERKIVNGSEATLQMILNAEDGAAAGVVQAYAQRILAEYGAEMRTELRGPSRGGGGGIEVRPSFWFNPELNYKHYMVPGILVILVTMIGTFLSSMNVVREKEIGTIEQLNVTPIRKSQLVVGKLLPFWILALVELAFGLGVAWIVFDIPIRGSLLLVFALAGLYLLVMLGFGLWISTLADTQQQAMFLAWFFIVIFILMSGLFTPIESMPHWAQRITLLNPIAHFIEIMRRVLLKGSGFEAVLPQVIILSIYAGIVLTFAARQYRKVSA